MSRFLLVLGLALTLAAGCDQAPLLVRTGMQAPAFTLPRLQGGTAAFPGDYPGRVVAIRFWADWCPYCYQEMRDLGPTAARLAPRGLVVVAVNAGQERAKVDAFVAKLGIGYPVLVDETGATARAYGVSALPTTFFVAADDWKGMILGQFRAQALQTINGLANEQV